MSTLDHLQVRLHSLLGLCAAPRTIGLVAALALSSSACGVFSLSTPSSGENKGSSAATGEDAEKDSESAEGGSSSSKARSSGKADPRNAPIDDGLVKLLGSEARYSASSLQTGESPMCPVINDRSAVSVVSVDKDRDLDCFMLTEIDKKASPKGYASIREFQDHHALQRAIVSLPSKKHDGVFVRVSNKTLFAVAEAEDLRILAIPCKDETKDLDSDFVLGHIDTLCDPSRAQFDVFASDKKAATSLSLADGKTKLIEGALAAAKARAEIVAKEDAEALKKARFPAIVSVDGGAGAVDAVKSHVGKPESKIQASAIKRAVVTSQWRVEKDLAGRPVKRTVDVTVGFARTDAYAADPNKKCAFVTYEAEQKHNGTAWGVVYASGFATKWTHIPCEKL
ncbi:MAG: hypothetical protein HOW73_22010 [Polyangiaceae bacterium]|nr:hypothetical protein [Polyangiaceae bacterium]